MIPGQRQSCRGQSNADGNQGLMKKKYEKNETFYRLKTSKLYNNNICCLQQLKQRTYLPNALIAQQISDKQLAHMFLALHESIALSKPQLTRMNRGQGAWFNNGTRLMQQVTKTELRGEATGLAVKLTQKWEEILKNPPYPYTPNHQLVLSSLELSKFTEITY